MITVKSEENQTCMVTRNLARFLPIFRCVHLILLKHLGKTIDLLTQTSNGAIERSHCILPDAITKYLFETCEENNWDLYLPFVL